MNLDRVPQAVLAKLLRIDAAEKQREKEVQMNRERFALLRDRLIPAAQYQPGDDFHRLRAEFDALVAQYGRDGPRSSSSLAPSLRSWIEELPAACTLEPVEVKVTLDDGQSVSEALATLRAHMNDIEKDIEALRKAPVPPDNIEQLARDFVEGAGLDIGWTEDRLNVRSDVSPLTLLCALQPEQTVALLLRLVEQKASVPLPVAQRPARLRELNAALTQCEYEEEALYLLGVERGEDVRRSALPEPQAILQVKVNKSGNSRRAA